MIRSLLILALVVSCFEAMAQTPRRRMRAAPYGDAGCGLGSVVFGNEKGPVQIVAATLNFTGMQTIAMSFGTSNCRNAFTAYIDTNREAIAKDMARGEGESLAGLLEIMGCENKDAAAQALQANYDHVFPSVDVETATVEENIQSTLSANNISCSDV